MPPTSSDPGGLGSAALLRVWAARAVSVLGMLCCARLACAQDGAGTQQGVNVSAAGQPLINGGADMARVRSLELSEQSSALYEQGDFRGAVALLEEAYAAFPEPVLLYNMGRAQEGLGDDEAAIRAYQRYLAEQPVAKDRGAITRRLQTLKERVEERRRLAAEAASPRTPTVGQVTAIPEGPPAAASQGTSQAAVLPWVICGVGALGLATGGALWLLAVEHHDRAVGDPNVVSAQNEQSQARDLANGATIGLVSGGILMAGGAAWGIVTLTSSRGAANAAPRIGLAVAPGAIWVTGRL